MSNPLDLKPCPFCGGQANSAILGIIGAGHGESFDEVMVYCTRCSAKQSDIDHTGVEHVERAQDTIKRWNRRPAPGGFKP